MAYFPIKKRKGHIVSCLTSNFKGFSYKENHLSAHGRRKTTNNPSNSDLTAADIFKFYFFNRISYLQIFDAVQKFEI